LSISDASFSRLLAFSAYLKHKNTPVRIHAAGSNKGFPDVKRVGKLQQIDSAKLMA
jgi:hypothetical protein